MFEEMKLIKVKTLTWVEPPFEPEIDLNFLGLNAKVIIKMKEDINES